MVVLGLWLVAFAAVFALLPVTIHTTLVSVGCNPFSIGPNTGASATGSSYVPAVEVWLAPSSVTPGGETYAAEDQAMCQSTALSQITPGFILGGIGIALLVFSPIVPRYVARGRVRKSQKRRGSEPPLPL